MRLDKGCNILVCVAIIIIFELCKDIQCQFSIQVNTRVAVQESCCVIISCTFWAAKKNSFTNSKGFWKNINNVIVTATNNSDTKGTKTNFHITGDTDKGDCTLTIKDAKKEDSGMYFFRLEGPVSYNYKEKTLTVTVTDPPKKPEVVITSDDGGLLDTNSSVLIKEGKSLTLNCSAVGKKTAKVTWVKGNGQSSLWSTITITQSEADTYRCLAWDEHWISEKHLQISSQVNNTEDETRLCGKENKVRRFDLLIGIVCGMAIAIFFILASKLIARKFFKMDICLCVHTKYDPTVEPPEEDIMKENAEDVYMNVGKPEPITKTSEDAKEQQDSNSNPNDQEEIHYSNVVFSSQPTRTLPMQPETEYAEIVN